MGHDTFVHATHGLDRLDIKDAFAEFLRIRLLRGKRIVLGKPGPEPLFPAFRVIIESLAESLAATIEVFDKLAHDFVSRRSDVGVSQRFPGLRHYVIAQLERYLVSHREWPDRHACLLCHVLDQCRIDTFCQHRNAFPAVGTEHAAGVETPAVVDHDWRLADLLDVIQGLCDRHIAGFLTDNDFNERHLVNWREEVNTDEQLGALRRFCQARDRQRRCI